MRRKLIALGDENHLTDNFIKYVGSWAKRINGVAHLVCQTGGAFPVFADFESRDAISRHRNEKVMLDMMAVAGKLIAPEVPVVYSVSENQWQQTLAGIAEDTTDYLVLVGLKEVSFFERLFTKNMALTIIEAINNVIVAIPEDVNTFSQERIFIEVSDQHPLDILSLNRFLNFIDEENTQLIFFALFRPMEPTKETEKRLEELVRLYKDRFYTKLEVYEADNPNRDIKKVINNSIDEVLVIQKNSRMLTEQRLRNFMIKELVYEGQTPLVILP